jgi:heme A synthase
MEFKTVTSKGLLIATSFLEGSTGLALMTLPSFVVTFLLGSPLTDSISVLIARVAGAALVAIAIACWFSRKFESQNALIVALLFYNLASVVLLVTAGLHENLHGVALWPAAIIHVAMAALCAVVLLNGKITSSK